MTLISDTMLAAIGRSFDAARSYPVAGSDIRRWAIATAFPDPPLRIHWDEEHAARTHFGGIVAPEDFNPFAWAQADPPLDQRRPTAGPDFIEDALGIPGPGLATHLNGGLDVSYGVPVRPGDVIDSLSTLREYRERPGREHRLLFTTWETTWHNQHGELVRTAEQVSIRF